MDAGYRVEYFVGGDINGVGTTASLIMTVDAWD